MRDYSLHYVESQPQHEDILKKFATNVASLPFDRVAVVKSKEEIEKVAGRELAVEACATAAMFEQVSKIADVTGVTPRSDRSLKITLTIFYLAHHFTMFSSILLVIVVVIAFFIMARSAP
mmetsp:Transcript_1975/g.2465  ORF Transcript_1975/g.2465 Transcript_1975/m.2465 type:complete len:120 (-) Transcript_1975:146-505(-)